MTKRKNLISKDTLWQIFRDNWEGSKRQYPKYDIPEYDEAVQKMLGCGSRENGYAAYRCMHCGEQVVVAFSCKSSLCLSCARSYVDRWVEYISIHLFPEVKYRHVVLTMPEELRIYFYRDKYLLAELASIGHKMMGSALWRILQGRSRSRQYCSPPDLRLKRRMESSFIYNNDIRRPN